MFNWYLKVQKNIIKYILMGILNISILASKNKVIYQYKFINIKYINNITYTRIFKYNICYI